MEHESDVSAVMRERVRGVLAGMDQTLNQLLFDTVMEG